MGLLDSLFSGSGNGGGLLDGLLYPPSQFAPPPQKQYDALGNPLPDLIAPPAKNPWDSVALPDARPQAPAMPQMAAQPPIFAGSGMYGLPPQIGQQPAPAPAPPQQVAAPQTQPQPDAPNMVTGSLGSSIPVPTFGQPDPAQIPQNAKPAQAQISPDAQPQAQIEPSFGNRLMAGFTNFGAGGKSGGLIGAIGGGISGLSTGQRNDAAGIQQQQANLTARALLAKGVDPQTVQAAVVNPDLMKTLITQTYGPDKNSVVKIGQNELGQEQYGIFNANDGTIKPLKDNGSATPNAGGSGALGDMTKTGLEYLATLPQAQAGIVKGMLDGTIQPPTSFAMSKPYWQSMLAAAKQADPTFDENTWSARHKMTTDMAASGNSSMGGILANGKSSFEHLKDLSNSFADLGNKSHDFPGGGAVASVQNYTGNVLTPSSATKGQLAATNDNLMRYGQESTKFYAGSGGSEPERMGALVNMNPATTSGEEQAAYLAKEKSLMLDRLQQKEAQIRDTMGDRYLAAHPVFTPELQKTIDTIDANIAKLRGTPQATSGAQSSIPPGWTVRVH